jgi:hypothetical protein
MLDACAVLIREFNCTVVLVHHTGNADEAQHRARGSSAWRGALDIEVSIIPAKDGAPMQVVQRKSKDAELAEPIYMQLESVEIPGWIDEDGEQVSSAVAVQVDAPEEPKMFKKESKIEHHRRTFENAWFASGREDRDGLPYMDKEKMYEFFVTDMGFSEASAAQYVKPSASGKTIAELLNANILRATLGGWVVIDEAHAASMMMRKASK